MAEYKRRTTQQGLGATDASRASQPRVTVKLPANEPRVTVKLPAEGRRARTTLPVPGTEENDGRPDTAPPVSSARARSSGSDRAERKSRDAIVVDDVGDKAVELTSRPPLAGRPRIVKTRKELAEAPLDHREAFLLSFIDGKLTVTSLVDVSGMPEAEVHGILTRLRRLGIIVYG